jgi:MFS family permease
MGDSVHGYSAVFRHPVAGRLASAKAVSELGDYVGLSSLIVLTYSHSHSLLGPVAVYAARGLPALAVATIFPGWIDRPRRKVALIWLALLGAAVISVPAFVPSTGSAIIASAVLGAVRATYMSVHTAVIAESVDEPLRLPLFGLMGTFNQAAQVVGVASGSLLALYVSTRLALLADTASFVMAAVIFLGLPQAERFVRDRRPPPYSGLRTIFGNPTLRLVALLTWATFASSGLPETMARGVAPTAWVPWTMAGTSMGGTLFTYLVARRTFLRRIANQILTASVLAVSLCLGALVIAMHAAPLLLVLANVAIGAAGGWTVGAQATFARLTPRGLMGQVEASMVAQNVLVQGVAILALGWLASATGQPALSYLAAGVVAGVAAVLAWMGRPAEPSRADTFEPVHQRYPSQALADRQAQAGQ